MGDRLAGGRPLWDWFLERGFGWSVWLGASEEILLSFRERWADCLVFISGGVAQLAAEVCDAGEWLRFRTERHC